MKLNSINHTLNQASLKQNRQTQNTSFGALYFKNLKVQQKAMQSEKFTELLKNSHIQEVMDKYNSPYVKQITVDGINNTVLTLKPHMDLGKIGFSDKIKVEDLNVLAHGLDN